MNGKDNSSGKQLYSYVPTDAEISSVLGLIRPLILNIFELGKLKRISTVGAGSSRRYSFYFDSILTASKRKFLTVSVQLSKSGKLELYSNVQLNGSPHNHGDILVNLDSIGRSAADSYLKSLMSHLDQIFRVNGSSEDEISDAEEM